MRSNDLGDALQVVGVVGDDQRVIAGVDVDGVVGADQRPQHRQQVVGVLEVQLEDLRDDLVTAPPAVLSTTTAPPCSSASASGTTLSRPADVHHGEALQAQHGQKLGVGDGGRHAACRVVSVIVPLTRGSTTTSRPVMRGHGTGHRLNLGVDEVQRDGVATSCWHRAVRWPVASGPRHVRKTGHCTPSIVHMSLSKMIVIGLRLKLRVFMCCMA